MYTGWKWRKSNLCTNIVHMQKSSEGMPYLQIHYKSQYNEMRMCFKKTKLKLKSFQKYVL